MDTTTPPPCVMSSMVEVPEERNCPPPHQLWLALASTETAPTPVQQPSHPDVRASMSLGNEVVGHIAYFCWFFNHELLWCSPYENPPPFGNIIVLRVCLSAYAFQGELASRL